MVLCFLSRSVGLALGFNVLVIRGFYQKIEKYEFVEENGDATLTS